MINKLVREKTRKGIQHWPNPSYVEVPRPSSSIIIRDLSEAPFRMDAVSSISCIKVDTPWSCQINVNKTVYDIILCRSI